MLNAHHLEYSTPFFERGDALAFTGGYNGVPMAVVSTGFGKDNVLSGIHNVIGLGATEVVYIGACLSTTGRHDIRDVILAAGGNQSILNKAITAASLFGITVSTRTVLSSDGAQPEEGCIIDDITGGFYELAQINGIKALSILTVSENTINGEKMEEHEVRSRFYAASRLVFELFAI